MTGKKRWRSLWLIDMSAAGVAAGVAVPFLNGSRGGRSCSLLSNQPRPFSTQTLTQAQKQTLTIERDSESINEGKPLRRRREIPKLLLCPRTNPKSCSLFGLSRSTEDGGDDRNVLKPEREINLPEAFTAYQETRYVGSSEGIVFTVPARREEESHVEIFAFDPLTATGAHLPIPSTATLYRPMVGLYGGNALLSPYK